MTALDHDQIAAVLATAFPRVATAKADNGRPFLLAPREDWPGLAAFLRDQPALCFDALMDLTGYDLLGYPCEPASDAVAVVYLLFSYAHRHELTVKLMAPRADCRVPSASGLWPAALYFEREVWDLLGVQFDGHPSLARILCPSDWQGHPLRKDYAYPVEYHGVPHQREGQHFEAPAAPAAGHGGKR